MLLVLILLSAMYPIGKCEKYLTYQEIEKPKLDKCIETIIRRYFVDHQLSYFNTEFEDDHLLDDLHSTGMLTVQMWKSKKKTVFHNAYMIVVRDERQLFRLMAIISNRSSWNPTLRFLIVIKYLKNKEKAFDVLLKFQVIHVVVVNGTDTAELFTYNPYDNFACGNYYVGITEFGKCSDVESVDLYPHKIVTDLRNCTFHVSCAHWPPYAIDPKKTVGAYVMGTEQYIFDTISKIEKFNYTFHFNYDPEKFSVVNEDMSVSGPLTMLQRNLTNVLLGGLILTQMRTSMFCGISGHLDQLDSIKIIVKQACVTPAWKNLYIEFSPLVWSLVLLVLILYAALLVMLLKEKDTGRVVLTMFDNMLLHGSRIHVRKVVRIVLIIWLLFAFLISYFYQSILVSLTMKPSLEYQVKDEKGLNAYGLKACISQVMRQYMEGDSHISRTYHNDTDDESCAKVLTSIKTVSKEEDRFTISPYGFYYYYKHELHNEYGKPLVYTFAEPFNKLIYAMYFHKSFPKKNKLLMLALRIRETGLSHKSLGDHFFSQAIKHKFRSESLGMRFAIPWRVYIGGIFISTVTLLAEVISAKQRKESTRLLN